MVKKFLTFIDLKIQYSVIRSRLLSLQPIQSSARFYILFNIIHTKQAEVAVTLHTCMRKKRPAGI